MARWAVTPKSGSGTPGREIKAGSTPAHAPEVLIHTTPNVTMNRRTARCTLDAQDAAIARNVDDYMAGRITYEEFGHRNRAAHDALATAGQSNAWMRRWRRGNPRLP